LTIAGYLDVFVLDKKKLFYFELNMYVIPSSWVCNSIVLKVWTFLFMCV